MKIQLNTDKNISGTENLETYVAEKLNKALKHYADRITRLEVHLSDQNGDKGGANDIQCKIEARVEAREPIMVTSKNATKEKAIDEAADKMKAALHTMIGKLKDKK